MWESGVIWREGVRVESKDMEVLLACRQPPYPGAD
jgi:hypothetical protein